MRIGLRTAVEEPSWKANDMNPPAAAFTRWCPEVAPATQAAIGDPISVRVSGAPETATASELLACAEVGCCVDSFCSSIEASALEGTWLALSRAVQIDSEAVEGVCSTAELLEAVPRRASRDSRFSIRVNQSSEPYIMHSANNCTISKQYEHYAQITVCIINEELTTLKSSQLRLKKYERKSRTSLTHIVSLRLLRRRFCGTGGRCRRRRRGILWSRILAFHIFIGWSSLRFGRGRLLNDYRLLINRFCLLAPHLLELNLQTKYWIYWTHAGVKYTGRGKYLCTVCIVLLYIVLYRLCRENLHDIQRIRAIV